MGIGTVRAETLPKRSQRGSTFDLTRVLRVHSYAFALVLTVVLLVINVLSEKGGFGLNDQLANVAPMAIAGLACAPSIIAGGFDLSISPLMFLTNSVFVVWLAPHGLGGVVSIPIMLAIGTSVGLLTGLLIVALRVQPIVVTLAMYFVLQGVDLQISPTPVSISPGWVGHLAKTVGPIPGAVFTMGVPLVIWFLLRFVPLRRLFYAVGSNDATAYSSGVNVSAVRVASYGLGGLIAAIGGYALTSLVASTNSSNATEYTLLGIAAIALGGTSLAGGRGGLLGVLFGAFSLYLLQNVLAAYNVNPAYLQVVYGGMLIVAVVLVGVLSARKAPRVDATSAATDRTAATVAVAPEATSRTAESAFAVSAGSRSSVAVLDAPVPSASVSDDRAPVVTRMDGASPEPVDGVGSDPERKASLWFRLGQIQARFPILQIVAVIVVFLYGSATLHGLGSWSSIRSILVITSLVGLASTGPTILILMGGFDLSVSGIIVASALTVTALSANYHIPIGWCVVIAAVGSGILGAIAGQICHRFKIQPLIVTLAMGTIAVGTVQVLNSGLTAGGAPQWLTNLTYPTQHTFGVHFPPLVVIWIAVALVMAVVLHRTVLGRRLLATGANPRAAGYALINTRRVWTMAFAFSAIASALVGVILAGYAGTVASNLGDPYLFQSIVAVIVGGTIFGGPGDYTRTCVGALFLTVLTTVLVGHGASPAGEQIIYGLIILVAITIYGRQRSLRDRL